MIDPRSTASPSSIVAAEHTYRPGKHPPTVDPFQSSAQNSRTTAPLEPGSIVPRLTCSLPIICVPCTIVLSDQRTIIPHPALTFNQIYPSCRTRRPNIQSLGHDRSDRTAARSRPSSQPNVPTNRLNGPVDPKPILKPILQDLKPNYLADFIDLGLAALKYLEHYKYIILVL
ncbi:unnamed protein product [Microthlaspi erraticum]|uniref:Uncharacterized protein n=1 Tax=Microthlaspi erraticum TaxID=1685480 RepID=A0A6D2INA3_9BRAS|nr:unnamed protein product [Microthlaspi erraticum]